jgi:flagellar biogenesis protein FliO
MHRLRKQTRKQRAEAHKQQPGKTRVAAPLSQAIKLAGDRCWLAIRSLVRMFRAERTGAKLCLRHTVPLGEKRFVAVVEFEGERFLVGSASHSVTLLARLKPREHPEQHFEQILRAVSTQELMIQ